MLAQLPREAVDAPSLEVPKARLDGALGSLSWWVAVLPTAGGELDRLQGHFHHKLLCESIILTSPSWEELSRIWPCVKSDQLASVHFSISPVLRLHL